MVIELLNNRTPPLCIPKNILAICKLIVPKIDIVKELPCISFCRSARSTLVVFTKTLAAYEIANAEVILKNHNDGTKRRQIAFDNNVCRIQSGEGYKNVCLNAAILSKNKTAECITASVVRTFAKGRGFLDHWRKVTEKLFLGRADLLEKNTSL